MEIRRIEEFTGLKTEPQGRAFLLTFNTAQGPLGIEVLGDRLPIMFRALFAAAQRYGETAPPTTELGAVLPANTVPIPTEEFATTPEPSGSLWLTFRVGSTDLSIAFPDPTASEALGRALLKRQG